MNIELQSGLWPIVSNPVQLQNALLNLVLNARDAMPDGGVLTISSRNATLDADYAESHADVMPGDYVALTVKDTGVGMPPDARERAFEPFYTTKEVGGGSGLGLSMVYGLVKQSRGHATIESEPGYGTTVTLYLPRMDMDENAALAHSTENSYAPGCGENILIVEDDAKVQRLTVKRLKWLGYRVVQVDSGVSALQVLAEHSDIDLMFSDVIMPGGMSGIDLANEVRRRHPDVRVLLTSGYTEEALDAEHLESFLQKPYTLQTLAERLRDVLDS
jgi:CheY-like chemotaxis protein